MPMTAAQRKAKRKYDKTHYQQIQIKPKKEEAERIKQYVAESGESLTRFLVRAAETQMKLDKKAEEPS